MPKFNYPTAPKFSQIRSAIAEHPSLPGSEELKSLDGKLLYTKDRSLDTARLAKALKKIAEPQLTRQQKRAAAKRVIEQSIRTEYGAVTASKIADTHAFTKEGGITVADVRLLDAWIRQMRFAEFHWKFVAAVKAGTQEAASGAPNVQSHAIRDYASLMDITSIPNFVSDPEFPRPQADRDLDLVMIAGALNDVQHALVLDGVDARVESLAAIATRLENRLAETGRDIGQKIPHNDRVREGLQHVMDLASSLIPSPEGRLRAQSISSTVTRPDMSSGDLWTAYEAHMQMTLSDQLLASPVTIPRWTIPGEAFYLVDPNSQRASAYRARMEAQQDADMASGKLKIVPNSPGFTSDSEML